MCTTHANLSTSWYACNLKLRNRSSVRVNRSDTITALFSNKLYRLSKHCCIHRYPFPHRRLKTPGRSFKCSLMLMEFISTIFLSVYVGDSSSEVTGLNLKPTGMPDQKKNEKDSGNKHPLTTPSKGLSILLFKFSCEGENLCKKPVARLKHLSEVYFS